MKNRISNLRVISHVAVLALVLVIAVVSTFSWYNRPSGAQDQGKGFNYTQSGKINGEGGTIKTYVGTNINGVIKYGSVLSDNQYLSTEPGSERYFKTVITDNSNSGDKMVSLYLEEFLCTNKMGSAIHIGLTKPEKTYKPVTGTLLSNTNYRIDRICLLDNVHIASNGTVEVEWFIEIDRMYTGQGTIKLGTIHLVYN